MCKGQVLGTVEPELVPEPVPELVPETAPEKSQIKLKQRILKAKPAAQDTNHLVKWPIFRIRKLEKARYTELLTQLRALRASWRTLYCVANNRVKKKLHASAELLQHEREKSQALVAQARGITQQIEARRKEQEQQFKAQKGEFKACVNVINGKVKEASQIFMKVHAFGCEMLGEVSDESSQ